MTSKKYMRLVRQYNIRQFGFDTHARVLGITVDEAKKLWNEATGFEFKRAPRTEYWMLTRPEISNYWKTYWELQLPEGQTHLKFYLTPTAPILIPHGFITDKGSIPRMFQNLISNYDRELMMAFLVHDVECETQRMSRFMTDNLIYEVGSYMGADWLKLNAVYTAVRFGNRYGRKDKVVRGFNVSHYNRKLIGKTESEYLQSADHTEHLNFLTEMNSNRVKI